MIADPPVLPGAVQVTVDCVFSLELAVPMVGAPGTVEGIIEFDAAEDEPLPEAFVAKTVNV